MGISGLSSFVKKYGKNISLKELSGSTVAIDTPIFMYKFKYLTNTDGFITKFKSQVNQFRKYNITPIYVFDGVSPKEKIGTKEKRRETQTVFITKEEIQFLKDLFKQLDVEYFIAPGEGEKMCAFLNMNGYADFVMSNDHDTFVFGALKILTCIKNELLFFNVQEILDDLSITKEQFIDISIASGSDFHQKGISGIGINKALLLTRKDKDIYDWPGITEDFMIIVPKIREIFSCFIQEEKTLEMHQSSFYCCDEDESSCCDEVESSCCDEDESSCCDEDFIVEDDPLDPYNN